MASKSEQHASRWLRAVLVNLPTGADLPQSEQLQHVLDGLEFFLPEVLREIHSEWRYESLDGFYPVVARKTGEGEVEIFGQCILIFDQTLTPFYLRLQIAHSEDEVSWLELWLGERGQNGMVRTPYDALDAAMKRVYAVDGRADLIEWVYKVTFGERRL